MQSTEDQFFYYLLVDSLTPIEILVSFSALVRWGDSGGKANTEERPLSLCVPVLGYVLCLSVVYAGRV